MMDSIIEEDDYILLDKKINLEEEKKWLQSRIEGNERGGEVYLVAEINDRIVGAADINRSMGRASHTGNFGIAFEAKYREEGIGNEITKAVLEMAKDDLNLRMAKLEVYETNTRAQGLYKKMGFKEIGTMPGEVKIKNKYVGAIYMYKEL